jgi:hypothetical protein
LATATVAGWPGRCTVHRMPKFGAPPRSPRCTGSCSTCPIRTSWDQADEISEVSLAIATGLADDGDTVLALEVAEWFPALRFDLAGRCRLGSCRPVLSRLCDRVAYLLGLRLPGDAFHRG